MEWIQRNPKKAIALSAFAVLVVIILVAGMSGGSKPNDDSTLGVPLATPTATPSHLLKVVPTPTTTPVQDQVQSALGQLGQGAGTGSSLNWPGLKGGSMSKSMSRHHLELRVTSDAPIGTVGYIVPTSLKDDYGVVKDVGTSWSLSTIAYGQPDYAQLFMQAGARGYPITCTIIVDGHVTAHRSTEGPYGGLMCQG